MPLVVRPALAEDRELAYLVKRAALGAYVAQVWGWDDAFQRAFHASDWAAHRPDIVELDGQPIGTIEVIEHPDHLYLGELYLLPAMQRRGLGTQLLARVLAHVLARADALRLPVRLQFLTVNPVRSLYERHGFTVVGETGSHRLAERPARATVA